MKYGGPIVQRSVLVVDPETNHLTRLRALLAGNSSQVIGEAADPEEAMRQAAMKRPDVAVVAAELTGGDGIQLASRLETEHGIPTVLLAVRIAPADVARAARAGVMGLMVKPVDASTLHAMLELAVCRFQEILALRRETETLRRSLEYRKLIERAKGLLMEMEGIPEQEAFARIRQKSMDTQRPMAEIARAVILAAEVSGRAR